MKFLSLVLTFCLTANVFAASAPLAELERSFDEYQYKVTVEWDQKDKAFYEKETQSFFNELSTLMTQGLVKEDISTLLQKKVSNKAALEALKLKLSMLTKVSSSEELSQVLQENSKELYAKGASWNGDVMTNTLYVALAAFLAYEVWFYSTHKCVSYNEGYSCGTPSQYAGVQCHTYEYCELYEMK
jgi:hypothetical protein